MAHGWHKQSRKHADAARLGHRRKVSSRPRSSNPSQSRTRAKKKTFSGMVGSKRGGKIKGWRRSIHRARPTTKMVWESTEGDTVAIDHIPSSNIPYEIIIDGYNKIDSTGTLEKARKIAVRWMRMSPKARFDWIHKRREVRSRLGISMTRSGGKIKEFKIGDTVSFIDGSWKNIYQGVYVVSWVNPNGTVRLRDPSIDDPFKQIRLPQTFNPSSLKKESSRGKKKGKKSKNNPSNGKKIIIDIDLPDGDLWLNQDEGGIRGFITSVEKMKANEWMYGLEEPSGYEEVIDHLKALGYELSEKAKKSIKDFETGADGIFSEEEWRQILRVQEMVREKESDGEIISHLMEHDAATREEAENVLRMAKVRM